MISRIGYLPPPEIALEERQHAVFVSRDGHAQDFIGWRCRFQHGAIAARLLCASDLEPESWNCNEPPAGDNHPNVRDGKLAVKHARPVVNEGARFD